MDQDVLLPDACLPLSSLISPTNSGHHHTRQVLFGVLQSQTIMILFAHYNICHLIVGFTIMTTFLTQLLVGYLENSVTLD